MLKSCLTAVREWYRTNNLLLNADKSQAIVLGTANQLRSASTIDSVEVAGAVLSVETTLKSLGVTFDQRLTAVSKLCNYGGADAQSKYDRCSSLPEGTPGPMSRRLSNAISRTTPADRSETDH